MTTCKRPRSEGRLAAKIRCCECAFIYKALRRHDGHVSKTAKWLGVSRRALYDKMQDYGLSDDATDMRIEAGISGPRRKATNAH